MILAGLDHPFSDDLIEIETSTFPEAPELFTAPSELFHMMAIVVAGEVRHVARLSAPGLLNDDGHSTAHFCADFVQAHDDVTMEDFFEYYGADVTKAVSLETQVRLGEALTPLRSADLLYLALYNLWRTDGVPGVFAHLNSNTISSFDRIGMIWHPLLGRDDLRTPSVQPDGTTGFDDNYQPVWISCEENDPLLSTLEAFIPPVIRLESQP